MHRRAARVAAASVLVAPVVALAGCTDDALEPDPSESSEPAESPAPEPTGSEPTPSPTDGQSPTDVPTPTGVTTGGVAEGFPTDVVPVLPDSTISVSTVSSANGSRSVSLSGSTELPADQVLAFYRSALVAQGFTETAAGQAAGAPTSTFTRGGGAELLVVAVTTSGPVQTFTVGGTIAGG